MGYSLKYTGDKVQELLDKIENSKGLTSINGLGGGTLTSPLIITGGDGSGQTQVPKLILDQEGNGQITDSRTNTLFGFMNSTQLTVGGNSYTLNLRGSGTRPTYNGADMALKSDIPDVSGKANLAGGNSWTGSQQFSQGGYWFATDKNHPFVVELENGDALVTVNPNGVTYDSNGLGTMPFLLNGNAGTSGQVLTSQGAGKTPIWEDAPYTKPSGGIPKTDLASDVQASLGKADTAFQGNMTLTGNTLYITLNSTAADVQVVNPTVYNDIY